MAGEGTPTAEPGTRHRVTLWQKYIVRKETWSKWPQIHSVTAVAEESVGARRYGREFATRCGREQNRVEDFGRMDLRALIAGEAFHACADDSRSRRLFQLNRPAPFRGLPQATSSAGGY